MPTVRVNGVDHEFDGDPQLPLLWYLRDVLGLITTPELVVVDTPAASAVSDATAIAAQCEATLVASSR